MGVSPEAVVQQATRVIAGPANHLIGVVGRGRCRAAIDCHFNTVSLRNVCVVVVVITGHS